MASTETFATPKIIADGVDRLEFAGDDHHDDHDDHMDDHDDHDAHDDHEDDHDDHDDHMDDGGEHHEGMPVGRLLVADAGEAHLSVIDLSTDDVDSGIFDVAAPSASAYSSPTHRYGIVLAREPGDTDDRVHVFDGGIFLVEHGDHYDLVTQPISCHALEIAEELPIHYVNSHGWTAIFSDATGHVFMINEADLANSRGDYEPIVLEAGPQHGAALAILDEHVVVTTKNPDYPENSDDSLPVGVEVRDFSDQVVYDASNRSCPGMHGESHNDHGAAFGCIGDHDDHMDDHGDHDEHEDDHDDHDHEGDHDEHEDDHDDHDHEGDHDEHEDDHDDHGHEDDHDEHEDDHDDHDHEDDHDEHEDDHDDHEDDHGHEDDHDDHEDDHGHEGHDHGPLDPHFWFDPIRVKIAVNDIAARLSALDPEGADFYSRNASDYGAQLDELHSWIQEQVKLVPPDHRLLVTSHDTFSYFAALYGFEVIGLIIPSLATHIEPSAEHVAEVVEVVREHNAPAVFSETTVSAKLPEAIARETGAVLVQLYTGSLGEEGSPAGTYLGMFRTNVERMVEALR